MKKHIRASLFLGICLMFCLCAFTWEGELDPNEFEKWNVLKVRPSAQGVVWVFVRNPDLNSSIDIVVMILDREFTLLGYRYWKGSEPYVYRFNTKQDKYSRIELTKEEKDKCFKCHRNRRKIESASGGDTLIPVRQRRIKNLRVSGRRAGALSPRVVSSWQKKERS